MAHVVGNILEPRHIQMGFPLFFRADGILPLPAGYKVSARQAHRRKPGFLQRFVEILPQSLFIRLGMLRVVHASVYHGSDRFQKRAEQPSGDFPDFKFRMKCYPGLFHFFCLPLFIIAG